MPASNAGLQTLSSKLVKSRNCLHATRLKCETIREECDRARLDVEANDSAINALEAEETRLKTHYVETKLAYEKAYAEKYQNQQSLKQTRQQKVVLSKKRDATVSALKARQYELAKFREEHAKADQLAVSLSDKLEAVEKETERLRKLAQRHRDEVARYTLRYEALSRELGVVQASAAAV